MECCDERFKENKKRRIKRRTVKVDDKFNLVVVVCWLLL